MLREIKKRQLDNIERFAFKATHWIGSTESLLIHTALFFSAFLFYFAGIPLNSILLAVTTLVSFEAIYLSIFIQMSVNRQARKLHAVSRDIEEIQEDVEDIQENVEDIQEDVEEIQEDVGEIEKDVDEIQKDVDEIQEDVEDIEENVDELSEDIDDVNESDLKRDEMMLSKIEDTLGKLIHEINELKKQNTHTLKPKNKKIKAD